MPGACARALAYAAGRRFSQIENVRDHAQPGHRRKNYAARSIETVPDESYGISADHERYVEFRDLFQALDRLPEEQRSVVLIAVEDLSYAEAAQALDISIGTLMSRLWRGRKRLRAMMEGNTQAEAVRAK